MEQTSLLATVLSFVLIFFFLWVEILIARHLEKGQTPNPPVELPYTWEYFWGIQGFVFAFLAVLGSFVNREIDKSTALLESIATVFGWGVPGYFVIQRRSWAWVTLTILSLNLVVWGINYFYGKNRWNEFDQVYHYGGNGTTAIVGLTHS